MQIMLDDDFVWTPEYKRLPKEYLNIPALHMMGSANFNKTWTPLPTHYHNTMEIVVVLNGSQQYTVNDKLYTLYGRDLFITYPGEIHGNGNMPQNICEFIWFQIYLTPCENFLGLTTEAGNYLYQSILQYINSKNRILIVDTKDLKLLQDAWSYISSEKKSNKLLGYSYLLSFLIQYFCVKSNSNNRPDVDPDIQMAINYIEDNLTTPLSIMQIADRCRLSESRFKAKFKDQVGVTPLGFINSMKIEKAKHMIQDKSLSVTDIAFSLAFSSSNYFSSVFRKYTGYTPTEFRNADLKRSDKTDQ